MDDWLYVILAYCLASTAIALYCWTVLRRIGRRTAEVAPSRKFTQADPAPIQGGTARQESAACDPPLAR